MLETPPSPPPRTSRTRLLRYSSCKLGLRRSTRISRKQETPTLSPLQNILKKVKNNHAESKKIGVKVFGERARTEETDVKKQNAGNIALTTLQNIKNKIPNVFTNKDKFGKDNVKTLNTEYTPRTNPTVIPVTRNLTNTVKKP